MIWQKEVAIEMKANRDGWVIVMCQIHINWYRDRMMIRAPYFLDSVPKG